MLAASVGLLLAAAAVLLACGHGKPDAPRERSGVVATSADPVRAPVVRPHPRLGRTGLAGWPVGVLRALVVFSGIWAFWRAYPPPGDEILGAQDQGLYLAGAVVLASTGRYVPETPVLLNAPAELRPWVLGFEPAEAQRTGAHAVPRRYWNYHTGLFLRDQPGPAAAATLSRSGQLLFQFPPGFPALLASAFQVGGWSALAQVNRGAVALAAVLLGLLAGRWTRAPATVGIVTFLLALFFPLHVWISHTFFAEPTTLALWLLALWAWGEAQDGEDAATPSSPRQSFWADSWHGFIGGHVFQGGRFRAGVVYRGWDRLLAPLGPSFPVACLLSMLVATAGALAAWWQFSRFNFVGTLEAFWRSNHLTLLLIVGFGRWGWRAGLVFPLPPPPSDAV